MVGGFPFQRDFVLNIKETICSMINLNGGHIYIGIALINGKNIVIGDKYCESEK
jgi:hypothetical protein